MKSSASAPAKVILFGEHFVVHGTNAILCAIEKKVTVTSSTADGADILVRSDVGQTRVGVSSDDTDPLLGPIIHVARGMIKRFGYDGGLEVVVRSDIPAGVGLGSSSACCVAAAGSIAGLFGGLSKDETLKAATDAERTSFGGASGADGAACTYGGAIEYGAGSWKRVDVGGDLRLVVANSAQARSTGEIVAGVDKFRKKNPTRWAELCKKESDLMVRARGALAEGDLESAGRCMSENQKYLEAIGISNDKLRSMIQTADAECYGSKITGAGGGGCIVGMADARTAERTIRALHRDGTECFSTGVELHGLDTF